MVTALVQTATELRKWWRPTVYMAFDASELLVQHVQTGRLLAERPVAAQIGQGTFRWLAAGRPAEELVLTKECKLVNPFAHPRLVISDFDAAEYIVNDFVQRLFRFRLRLAAPLMIVHPRCDPDGGFLQWELRALHELAHSAGAARTLLWQGSTPSVAELLALEFHCRGQFLRV